MRRVPLLAGLALLPLGWGLAAGGLGMIGHMGGHMIAVAVAAPLIAWGISGTRADPASRHPRLVTPMAAMLVELAVVWAWHLPALRAASHDSTIVMATEQACFALAGVLLWSAVLGGGRGTVRASGIGALLLTSMHMTLLGVLVGLAPRPLYPAMAAGHHGLDGVDDQALGGVVMLLVGAASYFIGGLALLAGLLRQREARA